MDEDDALYSKLFGESAPEEEKRPPVSQLQSTSAKPTNVDQNHSRAAEPASNLQSSEEEPKHPTVFRNESTEHTKFSLDPAKVFEDDNDDDFDIKLDRQEPQIDDDELDLRLDEQDEKAPGPSAPAHESNARRYVRPGSGATEQSTAARQPGSGSQAAPPQRAAPSFQHPEYDPNDPGVLPSQAQAGQRIRLPGQTRVTPEEYREFLALGHGDIFNLDIDRVVDAPWRIPGADLAEFFNYGLTPKTWKEYCARVKQYQLENSMQNRIHVYGSNQDQDFAETRAGGGQRQGWGAGSQAHQRRLGWGANNTARQQSSSPNRLFLTHSEQRDENGGAVSSLPMPGMEGLPLPPIHWSDSSMWQEDKQSGPSQSKRSKWDAG